MQHITRFLHSKANKPFFMCCASFKSFEVMQFEFWVATRGCIKTTAEQAKKGHFAILISQLADETES